jgi:uncharacterized protein YqjF (DUF2071 family)
MPESPSSPAPSGRFLGAEWRTLAMLNWEVDPAILRPFVPRGTELDAWRGKTFVSAVGFLFLDTRLFGIPVPFHRDFEEVNLRFYVGRQGPEGWRRGVCFIREIVPRWAVAFMARAVYNERYVALPMRHRVQPPPDGAAEYGWKHGGRWNSLHARFSGVAEPLAAGSEEEFITEHYWGYSSLRGGGCVEYQVEHPRWRVWSLLRPMLDCDVAALYGPEFAAHLAAEPTSAFLADGSEVVVRKGRRLV